MSNEENFVFQAQLRVAFLTTDNREHFKDYANPLPHFGTAPEALIEGFKLFPKEIEVHIVSCLQQQPIRSPHKLADNVFYHPLHVRAIGWLKTGYQGCIRAVRRKLEEIQPDIVHGQGSERDCAVCAVLSGFPNVLTIHGNMRKVANFLRAKPLTYYWFASRLEAFCLRQTDGVVCISNYTSSNVSPYTRRSWLVSNAVHPTYFKVCRQPDKPPRILCIANISSWKNQIGLINSLELLTRVTKLKLVFAGRGRDSDPYFKEFKDMIDSRGWCEYRGTLDRAELQKEMSRASVGVLPSFEDNCPMVLLEAAACGLPFAASRVGGIPDLIEHGVTGLLFDPSSQEDMRTAITRMLSEGSLRQALAENARQGCKDRFAPESVAREHINIYRAVLGGEMHAKSFLAI
jgi:glycosyltransferase involved in cell wall biosynthesis